MIRIDEVQVSPQKVHPKEKVKIQVRTRKEYQEGLIKLPFSLQSKFKGGLLNGNSKNRL